MSFLSRRQLMLASAAVGASQQLGELLKTQLAACVNHQAYVQNP
jgi:hypothetical protein